MTSTTLETVAATTRKQQATLQQLQSLLATPLHTLVWHHQIGEQLENWLVSATPEQRQSWRRLLSAALDRSPSGLYKDLVFAREYTREEVRKLDSRGYSWALIEMAQRLPGKRARKRLLKQALAEGWNVAELRAAIENERAGEVHAGGRPMRVPATADLGLRQLHALTSKWLKFYQEIWQQGDGSVLKRLQGTPAQEASTHLRQSLRATQAASRELTAAAEHVEKALKRVERQWKARAAQ